MKGSSAFIIIFAALALSVPDGSSFASDGPASLPNRTTLTPVIHPPAGSAPAPIVPPAKVVPPTAPVPESSPAEQFPGATPPPGTKALTLEEAIDMALGGHPRIKGAKADVTAAEFRILQAKSAFWPQLSFQIDRNYTLLGEVTPAITPKTNKPTLVETKGYLTYNDFLFTGSWTVFDFGRTYFAVKSSRALEYSLKDTLTATEQMVAYDVMDAYYNLLKSQTLVKVQEETLNAAFSHLKQAEGFFEVGVKPRFDVTQAEVQVNNAKVSLLQANDAVKGARVTLNTKIGIPPLTPTVVEERPALEELHNTMEGYQADAVKNRPDLQSLQETVRSNELNVKGQLAGFLPTVSVTGSYDWYKPDLLSSLPARNIEMLINFPLFQGFLTVSQVGQARAAVLSSRYKLEDTKLTVLNDVSQAFISVEDAKASYLALETSVREAKENLDIAQGRYEAGVGPLIDVTDAQVNLTQTETNRAQAFYSYHLAFSQLMRSTGANAGTVNLKPNGFDPRSVLGIGTSAPWTR
ncbi:MAG: TolC family protein [Nitrospirota bacterium]